jgi:WD40 repeat protein
MRSWLTIQKTTVSTLIIAAALPRLQADLLLTRPGGGVAPPAVLRYNEITGAFITNFTNGRFDEEMEGGIFGSDGRFYVTVNDLGSGAVLCYGSTGAFLNEFVPLGSGGLTVPYALRFGANGDLFVSSISFTDSSAQGRILRYNGANGAFQGTFITNGAGGLAFPFDFVFGPDGNLYIADRDYSATGSGLGVLQYNGLSGAFVTNFVPRGSGGLTNASGLVFGPDGNLYVSSFSTDSVLRYNGTNGAFIDTFVPAHSGGLAGPQGLAFGPDERLYVCSAGNHAVVRYDGKTGGFVDLFVAPGSGGLSSGPSSLTFTPRGPKLKISRSATGVSISWPRAFSNFVLEARQSLGGSDDWSSLSEKPERVGEYLIATNPALENHEFFRLRRQ